MKARLYPAWISRLYILTVGALAFTGLLQMPLARRYYLTDVPGMAWTGDFFFVHTFHYMLAALLLFTVALVTVHWFMRWRTSLVLTSLGSARAGIIGGLIVSGGLRIYRNLPGVTLDPVAIAVIEWTHIVLAVLMGVVALVALARRSSAYARRR